jgi:hypothetical protein
MLLLPEPRKELRAEGGAALRAVLKALLGLRLEAAARLRWMLFVRRRDVRPALACAPAVN